jgi:glycosyltransferase involved in cell wall biosynthesis
MSISIVIPALNEEKLLPGLLAQFTPALLARHHIELVLSDGGSADRTRDIAREAGARVITHDDPGRQTIAGGRNAGAAAASGDVLVFVNADVRFADADIFFVALADALARPGVVAATCPVQVFPEEERPVDRAFHVVHNAYVHLLNAIGEGMGRGECQALPRDVFARVGGYNAAMAAGEDYDLFRRVRRLGRIAWLGDACVYESPRRFRRYGYARIVWGWTRNATAVVLRNRSSSDTWEAVR